MFDYEHVRREGKKHVRGLRVGVRVPFDEYRKETRYKGSKLLVDALEAKKPKKAKERVFVFQYHPILESKLGKQCIKHVVERLHNTNEYAIRWKYEGVRKAVKVLMIKSPDLYVDQRLLMRILGVSETEE
jgi:hypothetical protein